jgi:hypothetical protein
MKTAAGASSRRKPAGARGRRPAAWSGVAGGGGGGGGTGDSVAKLGVNATATAPNLLTVRSSDALFHAIAAADGGSGDMRLQIAKESASDTASVFFSDAYAGHAEFGLTGDNDFHLKVSADGTVWRDAVTFDCTTGRASFPGGGVRELLTANRTYYVRTDGSDANTGLANSAGGAFLTIQRAVDVIAATLDIAGYDVAIQVADGTYAVASQITLKNVAGFGVAGNLTIQGNAGAPGNVVISGAGHVFVADGLSSVWDIKNLKIQTTSGTGHALLAANGSSVRFGNLNFGSLNDGGHVVAVFGSTIRVLSNYTISGSAAYHWNIVYGSVATFTGITITLSGTPAFPVLGFAYISTLAAVQAHAITFVGSATGQRYNVSTNAVLFVNGAGATYLPGNSSGVSASGGLYV